MLLMFTIFELGLSNYAVKLRQCAEKLSTSKPKLEQEPLKKDSHPSLVTESERTNRKRLVHEIKRYCINQDSELIFNKLKHLD